MKKEKLIQILGADQASSDVALVGRLLTAEEVESVFGGTSTGTTPGGGTYTMGGGSFNQTGGNFDQSSGHYSMAG